MGTVQENSCQKINQIVIIKYFKNTVFIKVDSVNSFCWSDGIQASHNSKNPSMVGVGVTLEITF